MSLFPQEWAHHKPAPMPLNRRLANAACYMVASIFPRVDFPAWLLERAARHHFGERLGP